MKRARPADLEREGELDEAIARSLLREEKSVAAVGPPWMTEEGHVLDSDQVRVGMKKEDTSIRDFDVYDLEPESVVRKAENAVLLGSRWVLKQATPETVKARVVAQELNRGGQKRDVFAASPTTVGQRLLLERAVRDSRQFSGAPMSVCFGDVSTAFLHASLPMGTNDPVYYVLPPAELRQYTSTGEVLYWRLKKALYGLRAAPRFWQEHMAKTLKECGWQRCQSDPQLYRHGTSGGLLSVFADDLLLAAPAECAAALKADLGNRLKLKWLGELTSERWTRYLGRELKLSQEGHLLIRVPPAYWEKVLQLASMADAKGLATPATPATVAITSGSTADDDLLMEDAALFRSVVGALMWACDVRPDLAFAVKELARGMAAPTESRWTCVKRVLRYVCATRGAVLDLSGGWMPEDDHALHVFCDASWAYPKSTSGGCLMYRGILLATWSRTQAVPAMSSCEAELLAMVTAMTESRFAATLLEELGEHAFIVVHTDSASARQWTWTRGLGRRLKHLQLRVLWLQEEYRNGAMRVDAVSTEENTADLFTKALGRGRHEMLCQKLGMLLQIDGAPRCCLVA